MAAPTVKEVTPTVTGNAQRVGGVDWNQLVEIIKGTHATERIPGAAIEDQSITALQIGPDEVGDSEVAAHTSTKITITDKSQLNSAIVFNDQANVFGDFNQTFKDNKFRIESPDGLTPITIVNSQQTLARNLTIPILTGAGRKFVVTTEASQIVLGTEVTGASTSLTDTANIAYLNTANIFGDFNQTFKDNRILIESPDGLTPITIVNSQQTVARNLTIPILTGNRTIIVIGESNQITDTEISSHVSTKITGLPAQTQALNMNTNLINGVVDPVALQDAATKNFVDTAIAAIPSPSLSSLSDTTITGPLQDGDFLIFDTVGAAWKDLPITGDIAITKGGVVSISADVILNADVNSAAAIAYSKLDLTGLIVNGDLTGGVFAAITGLGVQAQTLDMGNNQLTMGTGLILFGTGESISIQSADMVFDVTTGDVFKFDIAGTTAMTLFATGLRLNNGFIDTVDRIEFSTANFSIQDDGTDLLIDVHTGGSIDLRVANTVEYDFGAAAADFNGNNIIDLGDVTFADSSNIITNATTGSQIATTASQKIAFWGATPVVQPTALTTQLTQITFVDENTPDFALASLKLHSDDTGAGFADLDEAQAFVEVVANLQTRVAELETKLQAVGILA